MRLKDKPLWQHLYSPTGFDELTELRDTLATSPKMHAQLEGYLHAKALMMYSKARREINPELRLEYQHTANALVEILGELFQPIKQTTDSQKRL